MHIKQPALQAHLQKNIGSLYILVGPDPYEINESVVAIKKAWRQRGEADEKLRTIQAPSDWHAVIEEANSYSLFTEWVLLDIRFDKKTLDATAKQCLMSYLKYPNPRSLIIIQAPAVPPKTIQWLSSLDQVILIQLFSLSGDALLQWIVQHLRQHGIPYEQNVPELIYQYSLNNKFACAQIIEKLALTKDDTHPFTQEDVRQHLIDQSEFQLYELAEACLLANIQKAIQLLRQAAQTRVEPTLILWLLTQEIRLLIQLTHLIKQSIPYPTACSRLKIWPQRARSYELTLRRLPLKSLYQLLQKSKRIDDSIKSNDSTRVWQELEQIAAILCLGVSIKSII